MTTIFLTGATGTVGSNVVAALANVSGVAVRCGVRTPDKASAIAVAANVGSCDFDFTRTESIDAAVDGADKICLITPGSWEGYRVEESKRLIDAARAADVRHIVRISLFWAGHEPEILFGRWHRELELYLEASGIPWTILRPSPFMDNFIKYTPPDREGNIHAPVGDGASSYIDTRDVGDATAAVLTTDGHEGRIYSLTGPEALTVSQVADAIGRATGRTIRYVAVPEEAARRALAQIGAPSWFIDGQMEAYDVMRRGYTSGVTDAVHELTGHRPRSIDEFARDHSSAWA